MAPASSVRTAARAAMWALSIALAPACGAVHGRFEPRHAQEPVPSGASSSGQPGVPPAGSIDELIELLEKSGASTLDGVSAAPQEPVVPAGVGDPRPETPAEPTPAVQDPGAVPPTAPQEPGPVPPEAAQPVPPEAPLVVLPEEVQGPRANPYLAFGPRIVAHADGRITKPYPLPPQKGRKLLHLLALYGDMPLVWSVLKKDEGPEKLIETRTGGDQVEAILLEEWDFEYYQDLRVWPPKQVETHSVADWLVVTANPSQLDEVEHFLNLFAASIPQIEIEASIVELTENDGLDWGAKSPPGVPMFDFPDGVLIDSFSPSFPNLASGTEALLTLGAVQDEVAFNAILEVVKTWENVAIDSRPKVAVREGGRAEIVSTVEIPFFGLQAITSSGGYNASLTFKEVGVRLYIVPRVVGTDTLALNIDVESGSQLGTAVAFEQSPTATTGGQTLTVPVIARRAARTVVYLQPGQALILGGLTTTRDLEQEQKVPVLGDIPLLGYLFKSKTTRKERSHVLFFIRPRILEGLDLQRSF